MVSGSVESREVSSTSSYAPAWAIGWSVVGVVLIIAGALRRLVGHAAEAADHELTAVHALAGLAWAAFMLYAEAWRGFHRRLSPRLVRRAWELPMDRPAVVLAAPLVVLGLMHATRRRLVASWLLVVFIVLLVLGIRQLEQPWRGIIDLGVVLGLTGGTLSILWFVGRAARGQVPDVDPDWPTRPNA